MWPVLLVLLLSDSAISDNSAAIISCEEARLKCAYRIGCGRALQNYMIGCSAVLQEAVPLNRCPEICQHSLIALTSTEEGAKLMNCKCSDSFCEDQKRRTDICRPIVLKSMGEPVVPCRVAQWICEADALCSTALDFYNSYCKSMFAGRKCTARCHNSISILRRQDKAAKLTQCRCDGLEEYDCRAMQHNMDVLCFHKRLPPFRNHHRRPNTTISTKQIAATTSPISIIWILMVVVQLPLVLH